jgi:NTE family protein
LLSLLDLSFYTSGILDGANILCWLRSIIGDVNLEELTIPCWVVAADFHSSREVVLRRGCAAEAVRCSISIPGIFVPYAHQGHLLVDGGMVNCVPVTAVKEMGASKVIAVNVVPLPSREDSDYMKKLDLPGRELLNSLAAGAVPDRRSGSLVGFLNRASREIYYLLRGFNVIERQNQVIRSLYMLMYDASERQSHLADVVVAPDVAGYSWIEFNKCREFLELGERAAEEMLPAIKGILQEG